MLAPGLVCVTIMGGVDSFIAFSKAFQIASQIRKGRSYGKRR